MDGWLTTREAGDRLGVTPGRVRQMIVDGDLPSELFGRDRMIREADLRLVENRPKVGRPSTKTAPAQTSRKGARKASRKGAR